MCKLEKSLHPESVILHKFKNLTKYWFLEISWWLLSDSSARKRPLVQIFSRENWKKISTSLSTLVGVNLHDHMKNQWRTKLWKCTQQRCKFAQSVSKLPVYTLQKCNNTHIRFSVQRGIGGEQESRTRFNHHWI